MKGTCIVSLGVGGHFTAGLARLAAGARANGFAGEIISWKDYPDGCPPHQAVPYGFKPYCMDLARQAGFQVVIWLDAACVPVRSLAPVIAEASARGHMFQWAPYNTGEWCSDTCLDAFGLTRARAYSFVHSLWACAMALDVSHPVGGEFLDRWLAASRDGRSFQGAWTNEKHQASTDGRVKGHRHDQAVGSILAYQMGLPFHPRLVHYDAWNVMPVEGYEQALRLPWFPAPVLSNHNVK
jgi:hypothetical protein